MLKLDIEGLNGSKHDSKSQKRILNSGENINYFTNVYMVPFKIYVNNGNMYLTSSLDVKEYKLNH
jgi:hypothetical protein